MLAETDLFRQEFEIAAQHLEILRQQWALLPDQPGAPHPALEGMAEALLALKQAHDDDLSRQNEAYAARCQDLEQECACYRDVFEHAPHAHLLTDLSGAIQVANTPTSILFRASQDALVGEQLAAFLPEQVRETLAEHLAQLQAGEVLRGWEVCLQPPSGDRVEVALDAVPVPGLEHRLVALHWSVRDISRQVQADEALRHNEHMLRSFVAQSFDGIALTDEQGQVIEWNRAMETITGLPAPETIGRPIWEVQLLLDHASDPAAGLGEQLKAGILELLRSGRAPWLGQLIERTYVRPDGTSRVVQGAVFPFQTQKGFMLGSISRDVTDLKRTEEALRTSESRFRLLVESLHDGVWVISEAGDTTFVNLAMAQLLGCTVDEMVGVHLCSFVNQKDLDAVQAQLERRRQGISENLDFELRRKDGTPLLVNLHTTPIFDAAGAYVGALASVRDITKERAANDERERLLAQVLEEQGRTAILSTQAQRQAEELGAVLNAIPDPVAVWDTHGDVIRANPAALTLGIGSAKTGMVEVAAQLEVRHPNGCPISAEELPVARALRGEVIRDETEILVSSDGEEHEIQVSVAPVFSDGAIVACVVVSHDTTEKRLAEKERERLLAENRSQREFLERLVEAAPVGIAVLRGPDHRYELANPYYRAMTGAPDRPIIGRTIVEAIPDLQSRNMPLLMDQVYRTGLAVSTREIQLSIGPDHQETYWDTDRVPLHGPDGAVEGILVLAHEVTREVQDRRRIAALNIQAQQQAAEMEATFDALIEPMMVMDAHGRILKANPAAVEALGADPVNLPEAELGRRLKACTPDGRPIPPADLVAARALRGEKVRDDPQLLMTVDGQRAILAGAAPIGTGDQISGVAVAWHDITDLRRTEEALRKANERLEITQTAAGAGAWNWDIPSGRLDWSSKMFELFGLDQRTTVASFDAWRSALHLEDRETAEQRISDSLEGHSDLDNEYRVILPDGQLRWINALGRGAYDEQGRPIRMSGICLDITDRKCMEEALHESEERFRTVIDNSRDGINMLDLETGHYIFMSPAQQTLTGFSPEELRDLPAEEAFKRVHPDDREISISQQRAITEGPEEGMTVEYRWKVQSGEYRWFSDSRKVVRDEKGRPIALVGVSRDITEGKQAELALRESQQREQQRAAELEAVLEAVPAAVWFAHDPECLHISGNRTADEMLRINRGAESSLTAPSEMRPRNFRMFREGRELTAEELPVQQAARGIAVNNSEFTFIFDDGTIRHMLGNAAPLWEKAGRTRGSVAAFVDITDRKQIEEALRTSEEKYRLLFQSMTEGFALYELLYDEQGDPADWRVLEVNDAYVRHTGLARDRIVGRRISELFPATVPEYLPRFAAVVATQIPCIFETYAKAVDRHQRIVTFPTGGHRFASTIEDVTERKLAEKAIAEAETKLDRILQTMLDGMVTVDLTGQIVYANRGAERILEIRKDELLGTYFSSREWEQLDEQSQPFPPDQLPLAVALREQRDVDPIEHMILAPDGQLKWISVNAAPLLDEDGHLYGAVAGFRDISERKQAESALRETHEQLQATLNTLPDLLFEVDRDGRVYDFRAPQPQMLQIPPHELLGRTISEVFPAEAGQAIHNAIAQTIESGRHSGTIYPMDTLTGKHWYELSIAAKGDPRTSEGRLLILARDITDRVEAESALRKERDRAQSYLNIAGVIIIAMDADQKVRLINTKGSQVIGYPEDEILGAKGFDIFIPERMRDAAKTDFARLIAGELQPNEYAETPILTRDGEERLIAWHSVALRDEAGHTIGTLSSGEDITDRKVAEEALRVSEALFATVFSFSPDGIGILKEEDGIFLDVNEAFTKMLGCSRSEIVGHTWRELNLVPMTDNGEVLTELFREQKQLTDYEFAFKTRQDRVVVVLVSLVRITVNNMSCILAIGHDISTRRQSEEALRRAQMELAVSIQEHAAQEERQHLARELHDSVSQALYGVSLGINTALTLFGSDQTKVLEALHYALSLTHAGLTEMRALIFELRPESLVQEGLVIALTKLVDATRVRHGFEVELGLCDEPDAPLAVKEALYRIAQEALHNTVKHAHPSRLDVHLTCAPDSLMLEVCDNGEGFDPLAAYPGHLGLRSMRERAQLVGGTLDIISAQSCGTQIRARIPLAAPE
jgi:PAS domain S-box-containing protein